MENYEHTLGDSAELYLFCQDKDKDKFNLKKTKIIGYTSRNSLVFFELRRFLRKNNIDIVVNFTGSGTTDMMIVLSTFLKETNIITHNHGNFFWPKNILFKRKFFRFGFRVNLEHSILFLTQFFTYRFLFSSKDITKKLERFFFISKKKIFYLPSIIDTAFFKKKNKSVCRKKLGLKKKDKIIIYVGRLTYLKGADTLFKIIENNPNIKFLLVGSEKPSYDQGFKNIVYVSGATGKKLVDYYNSADLFLFLSRTEGNAFVPREAMSCEVSAIVSNIESLRLLNPAIKVPRDVKTIQKNIEKFFQFSEKRRKKIGRECRRFIEKFYSEKNLKPSFKKYFLE